MSTNEGQVEDAWWLPVPGWHVRKVAQLVAYV